MPLRTQQLEIRYIEVLEAFKTFKALVSGNETAFIDESYLHWDSWKNQVNTDTMTFVGHSFGGCTAVR
jgi:predicted dienelactone hydrolase